MGRGPEQPRPAKSPELRLGVPGLVWLRESTTQRRARNFGFLRSMAVNTPTGRLTRKTLHPMRKEVWQNPHGRCQDLCGNAPCLPETKGNVRSNTHSLAGLVDYTNHVININTRVTARVMMVLSRWRRVEGSAFPKVKSHYLHVSSELVKTKEQKA
jgi:hypothetical protein